MPGEENKGLCLELHSTAGLAIHEVLIQRVSVMESSLVEDA